MIETQIHKHLISITWKWRKQLLIVLLTTAILSSIVMLMRPDYYKASTIFYPANTSIQNPVFTEAEQNINYYGDDHDVDRMLSMATSLDTKMELIEELDLRKHYELEKNEKSTEKLFRIFEKSYKIIKTEFDAIKISFRDEDPEFAAKVANIAREKVDRKTQHTITSAQANVLKNANKSLQIIQEEVKQKEEKLKTLRQKYGIYDTESQSEAFAILESRGSNKASLDKRVKNYTDGISLVKSLEDQVRFASHNLVKYQSNTFRLISAMESEISSVHVVQNARPPISKAGPFRSLYVLGSLFLMGFLSLIVILVIEASKAE